MPEPARVTVTISLNQAAQDLIPKAARDRGIPLTEFELQPSQISGRGKFAGVDVEGRVVLQPDAAG